MKLPILALAAALIAGCATKPGSSTFTPASITPLVDSAAYTGTRVILLKHPEKRAVFEQANNALTALIASDKVTLVTLKTAVDPILAADIKELRDPNTALIVDGAITIADAALGSYQLTSDTQTAEALAIAKAARNGITRALTVVPAQ
jgi:uncharacterized lipoprotein YajG